jgi:plasmid stability protein
MVDILVRNIDEAAAAQLKKKAKSAGKSLNDFARGALRTAARPSKDAAWTEVDRIGKRIGKVSGDSTATIREWRDNGEPYR